MKADPETDDVLTRLATEGLRSMPERSRPRDRCPPPRH
jgi:hypothetical protein